MLSCCSDSDFRGALDALPSVFSCWTLSSDSVEAGQPVDGRLPVGEAGVGVDKPGQRALHLAECRGDLEDAAERHAAEEEARRGDKNGKMIATWP
jgi:hypothetical protein